MYRTLVRLRAMLMLSESDVRKCLNVKDCIDVNRKALAAVGTSQANVPSRLSLPFGDTGDWSLFKPASYSTAGSIIQTMGMKLVSIRADNPSRNLPLVPATILVVEPDTGMVSAIVAATHLTGMRTAVGSALSTRICRPDARNLVIFGAGLQAQTHFDAIQFVLKNQLEKVVIVNRTIEKAQALATSLLSVETEAILLSDTAAIQRVLGEAHVVVACTNTTTPLFNGKWLSPRTHINGIGSYTPDMQEIDPETVNRSHVIIDTPEAATVGDLKNMDMSKPPILLADLLNSKQSISPSTTTDKNFTFYKGVGTAIQDVMTAAMVVDRAKALGIGQEVDMS